MTENKTPVTLRDRGTHLLFEDFDHAMAKPIVAWILLSNYESERKYKNLTLMINSYGGDVTAAFSIIDAMNGSKLPVHTVGIGVIASCGLLTFISGKRGERILTPNTSILSHQYSWGSRGKQHELMAATREMDLTQERMLNHYIMCTGLDERTIKEKLLPAHDVWLSAEEAVELGVADKILKMEIK